MPFANYCPHSLALRSRSTPRPPARQMKAAGRAAANSCFSGGIVQFDFSNLLDRSSLKAPSKFAERKSTELMRTPVPFNLINPFGLRSARGLDWSGSAEAEIAA